MTGTRRGEVLGLGWRDVDLEGARLSVTQLLEQTAKKLSFKPPKPAKRRRTSLCPARQSMPYGVITPPRRQCGCKWERTIRTMTLWWRSGMASRFRPARSSRHSQC